MKSSGTVANFTGRLWSAQEQYAQCGDFGRAEFESLAQLVTKLHHSAVRAGEDERQFLFAQTVECTGDGPLIILYDWISAGGLIASVDETIERERIIIRRRDLLFHEHAEHANLVRVKDNRPIVTGAVDDYFWPGFAHVSFKLIVRLKTNLPGALSFTSGVK